MKKILLLFICTVSFLTSCSSNDDVINNLTNEDLVGIWNLTKFQSDLVTNTSYQGTTISGNSEIYGKNFDFTFKFTSEPNEYLAEGSLVIVSKTTIAGQTQTLENTTSSVPSLSSGDWEIKGDKLIFNKSKTPIELSVISFENNKLTLKQFINQTESQLGATVKIVGELIIVLEK